MAAWIAEATGVDSVLDEAFVDMRVRWEVSDFIDELTDAIAALMEEQQVFGYEFEGTRYDAGTTMGWLKASVEIALSRPDLGTEFRAYLRQLQL